jgi:hypothetical protein
MSGTDVGQNMHPGVTLSRHRGPPSYTNSERNDFFSYENYRHDFVKHVLPFISLALEQVLTELQIPWFEIPINKK